MTRMRPAVGVATALLTLLLAACTDSGTAGPSSSPASASAPSNPATATAEYFETRFIAVDSTGTNVVAAGTDSFCVAPRDYADTSSLTCAPSPGPQHRLAATFSPDGTGVVAFDNAFNFSGFGTARILDVATGTSVPVSLPSSTGRDDSDAAATSGPSTSAPATDTLSASFAEKQRLIATYLWHGNDTLIAVSNGGTLYRISASTGVGSVLGQVGLLTQDQVADVVVVDDLLVFSLYGYSDQRIRYASFSLTDASVRDPLFDLRTSERTQLLSVSPDASTLLITTSDAGDDTSGETALYSVASGTRTAVPGTRGTVAIAGAFSPDGSMIAIVGTDPRPDRASPTKSYRQTNNLTYRLKLARADGGNEPRTVADASRTQAFGPRTWSSSGWIITKPPGTVYASAWKISG